MRIHRIVSLGIVLALISLSRAGELPRYKLPVGRRIAYATTSESTGGYVSNSKATIELTVVRENPDGSRRIIFKTTSKRVRDGDATENAELAYADAFPDGRIIPNP